MKNVLFSGCSFTLGVGLPNGKNDENNFVNIFAKEVFEKYQLNNISVGGNSNLRIFLETCFELSSNHYDYAFVCWTSYPRHVFWLGLEEYETKRSFVPNNPVKEHLGNDISFDSKFLLNLRDNLSLISNAHYDILDIIRYINILKKLADANNTKIYFINNICHWDNNYFTKVSDPRLENLTDYTNKILNSHNRSDDNIRNLYFKMHDSYSHYGTIQEALWLNLYSSFKSHQIDTGNDNFHPGPLSHQQFSKYLSSKFNG